MEQAKLLNALIKVLETINETLAKIERNQRLHTKVVLGTTRTLSMPYSQAKDLTPKDIEDLGGKL